jgi:hypothetical protein
MEKAYKHVVYFFVAILIVALAGFYKTYFGLFPAFEGVNNVQHFHGTMMLLWLAMLIGQPTLIKYKRLDLHRQLGKVSYVLVPLMLTSMFLIGRMGYMRDAGNLPEQENIGLLALTIPDLFGFTILYVLAMINKKKATIHMRYIVGTSLLLISPGLGRIAINYAGVSLPMSAEISHITAIVVALSLVFYDIKKHRPYKPFLVAFIILSVMHLCWVFRMTTAWQEWAGFFARTFF